MPKMAEFTVAKQMAKLASNGTSSLPRKGILQGALSGDLS